MDDKNPIVFQISFEYQMILLASPATANPRSPTIPLKIFAKHRIEKQSASWAQIIRYRYLQDSHQFQSTPEVEKESLGTSPAPLGISRHLSANIRLRHLEISNVVFTADACVASCNILWGTPCFHIYIPLVLFASS